MKKTAILLSLTIAATALTGQVWADHKSTNTSQVVTETPAVQTGKNNPYFNAGIDDPKEFTTFFAKLQKAVSEGKSKEVSQFMSYPLNLIKNGKKTIIYTKESFVQKYDRIITSNVQKKLLAQNADDIFSNVNGIMIGDGEMWISKINNRLAVYSINAVDNPYEVAGIDNPEAFTNFLSKMQKAVAANNKKEVADFISYPLNVNHKGTTMKIKSEKQFIEKYNQVMTAKVKKKLLAQKADSVFVNWKGIMIGDGEVWISQFGKKIAVYAVNV